MENFFDNGGIIGKKRSYNIGGLWKLSSMDKPIVTSGLTLYLDAGNINSYPGSGTTWTDLSGNGNTATLYNGVTFTNEYMQLDGTDDYIRGSSGITTGSRVPVTLQMWANFNTITGTRWWLAVIGQYGGGALHCIGTSQTATGFGTWNGNQVAPNLISIGEWINVAVTYDGTTITSYVNAANPLTNTSTTMNFTSSNLTIGLKLTGEANYNGKISIVKTYNRALTAAEVLQNYNATRDRYGK